MLLEPRKPLILGQCELIYLSYGLPIKPTTPLTDSNFQGWVVGDSLDKPRTYTLCFYATSRCTDTVQLQIESEGYICKSNLVSYP
jgi:hypothetical protein